MDFRSRCRRASYRKTAAAAPTFRESTPFAMGTATAFMEGERQGAMAGLAMILAGIFTAVFAPLAVLLLY